MLPTLIDSHCHLNHERMVPLGTPEQIMAQAGLQGVTGALTICTRVADEFPDVLAIANAQPNVWCTIGTHPHDSGLESERVITDNDLISFIKKEPKIVGVGETGLDYYYDHADHQSQQDSFRKHIRVARETELPLIIHTRDADADTARLLHEEGAGKDVRVRGVLHCFTSSIELARTALDFGFYISFSGIITFKKSDVLRSIAAEIPLDRMLVETDSPYLAPEPHRGEVNQPGYVRYTAQTLANIKNISEEEMINHANQNFFTLFNRAKVSP